MEQPTKKNKGSGTAATHNKALVRVEPDGTVVYSSSASFADLHLAEERERIAEQNRKNARQPKRKAWAEAIARELTEQYPEATFTELWKKIPQGEGVAGKRYAGCEVYREGDMLCGSGIDGIQRIALETFRTGAWVRARNRE